MDLDEAPGTGVAEGARRPRRTHKPFSAALGREVCRRAADGQSLMEVCADPAMPCEDSVRRWAGQYGRFGRAYARARALGGRGAAGRGHTWCPVLANEIVARISEGELMTSIVADAHMPSLRTFYRWRDAHAEFDAEVIQARAALAERLGDEGWKLAMEATPQTAYLTLVRLGHLRWMTAVFGPRTYGRVKPTELPKEPEVTNLCYRHFKLEVHPQTGQHRVVGFTPDPRTMQSVRDSEGAWTDPVDPVAKAAGIEDLIRQRSERLADGRGD